MMTTESARESSKEPIGTDFVKCQFGWREWHCLIDECENVMSLPDPICQLGYPDTQLRILLGTRYMEFMGWMHTQTMGICEGRKFNYSTKYWEPTNCGPHGIVVPPGDLSRFLGGKAIDD